MKKILGLDLGTNSIGWAVVTSVDEGQNENRLIELSGSRIIPMDAATLGDFDKGAFGSMLVIQLLKWIRR